MQLSRITCASRADNDAPAATSAETAEAWPIRAAESNGVSPPAVFASRDAPAAASVSIAPTASSLAARCSGVCPFEPRAETDAPAATSPSISLTLTSCSARSLLATCSAVNPSSTFIITRSLKALRRHAGRTAPSASSIATISRIVATSCSFIVAATAPPVTTRSKIALNMLSPIQRAGERTCPRATDCHLSHGLEEAATGLVNILHVIRRRFDN